MTVPNGRVTPRRAIPIPDDLWADLLKLADLRHTSASELIRRAISDHLSQARVAGELPKKRRRSA